MEKPLEGTRLEAGVAGSCVTAHVGTDAATPGQNEERVGRWRAGPVEKLAPWRLGDAGQGKALSSPSHKPTRFLETPAVSAAFS